MNNHSQERTFVYTCNNDIRALKSLIFSIFVRFTE